MPLFLDPLPRVHQLFYHIPNEITDSDFLDHLRSSLVNALK